MKPGASQLVLEWSGTSRSEAIVSPNSISTAKPPSALWPKHFIVEALYSQNPHSAFPVTQTIHKEKKLLKLPENGPKVLAQSRRAALKR
jgi:hypothetical protein